MKKPVIIFIVSVAVLGGVAMVMGMWLGSDKPGSFSFQASRSGGEETSTLLSGEQRPQNLNMPPQAAAPTGTDSPLLPLAPSNVDAAVSMRESFLHGDPNAPKLYRDPTPQEQATPEEIADPKLYAMYEARQDMRLKKAYVAAAETEIPRLQQDIAKAKAMGLTKEQIAEGEEKLRRIQAMRDQLMSEHPEIGRQ